MLCGVVCLQLASNRNSEYERFKAKVKKKKFLGLRESHDDISVQDFIHVFLSVRNGTSHVQVGRHLQYPFSIFLSLYI